MAAVTSSAVVIPSFTGLKAAGCTSKTSAISSTVKVSTPFARKFMTSAKLTVGSSMKEIGAAVLATAASAILAANAMAVEINLGDNDGSLVFEPSTFSVSSGDTIVFKNNKAFPHNVIFDEDEVPAGVDAAKISMNEEDLLNSEGETYSVTLTEKGTYGFYCSPHQGAGMVGKVTVN